MRVLHPDSLQTGVRSGSKQYDGIRYAQEGLAYYQKLAEAGT